MCSQVPIDNEPALVQVMAWRLSCVNSWWSCSHIYASLHRRCYINDELFKCRFRTYFYIYVTRTWSSLCIHVPVDNCSNTCIRYLAISRHNTVCTVTCVVSEVFWTFVTQNSRRNFDKKIATLRIKGLKAWYHAVPFSSFFPRSSATTTTVSSMMTMSSNFDGDDGHTI